MIAAVLSVTAGAVPVPASASDCGLPEASSVTVTDAARAPVAVGLKVMAIVQLNVALRVPAPVGHGVAPEPATVKSPALVPVIVMLVKFSVSVPELVMVTVVAEFAVPMR